MGIVKNFLKMAILFLDSGLDARENIGLINRAFRLIKQKSNATPARCRIFRLTKQRSNAIPAKVEGASD